jgi:hypothetical protein
MAQFFDFSEPLLLPHLPLYYKECLEAHKDVHHMTRRITFRWAPRRLSYGDERLKDRDVEE